MMFDFGTMLDNTMKVEGYTVTRNNPSLHGERKKFFKERCDYDKLYDEVELHDCSEFTVRIGGDTLIYRVYGKSKDNFTMCER